MKQRAPDTFAEDWKQLKDSIERKSIPSAKSAVWESLIRDFPADRSREELESDLFKINRGRDYNFLKKDQETFTMRLEKGWLWLTFLGSVLLRRLSSWLWRFNLSKVASGNLMAYPRYRITLNGFAMWKEYAAFCEELGIATSSFNTAKLFYISSLLQGMVGHPTETLSILEIGGGTGNLAVMLYKRLPIYQYVIVDLPEMILRSSLTIRHFFPMSTIHFSHRYLDSGLPISGRGFFFVHPQDIGRISDDVFDVCLNIDSFQEMTADQVAVYLSFVQRSAKDGGLLINLNRRRLIEDFDNNPLLYPYHRANEIVKWETDPFMFGTLNVSGLKDPHVLRVERIRKSRVGG